MSKALKYVIPKRYGTVHVQQPDGSEKAYAGGDVVELSEKQAKALGATPASPPTAKHDVPPASKGQ